MVAAAAGGLAAGADVAKARAATPSAGGMKTWALKNFTGLSSFVMPVFTPDLKGLDDDGIRNEVRHSIAQGFMGAYVLAQGCTAAESERFLEVVLQEAGGKISVGYGGTEAVLDPRVGHTLMGLPDGATEDELYEKAAARLSQVKCPVAIYILPSARFQKFSPNGIPMKALDRLVDLPNVVATKLSQEMSPVTAFEVAALIGDRVSLGPVDLSLAPLLSAHGRVSWTGVWAVDSLQGPNNRYAVEYIDLMAQGKTQEAMKVFYAMRYALEYFYDLQGPTLKVGGHPWAHIKYAKWLTGGNGGLSRRFNLTEAQVPTLTAKARKGCRTAFERVGIKCVDLPDEAFAVGNAAYARGARLKDMPEQPHYRA